MQTSVNIFVLACALVVLPAGLLQAQSNQFTFLTKENGMPSTFVKCVTEDQTGQIWAGTDNGLVRYDGWTFTSYVEGLPSPYIKDLLLTNDKRLLALTDMGLVEVGYREDSVSVSVLVDGGSSDTDTTVFYPKQLHEDQSGNIWIANVCSVSRLVGQGIRTYRFPDDCSTDFLRSYYFFEDQQGHLWAVSFNGKFYRYDTDGDRFELLLGQTPLKKVFGITPHGSDWIVLGQDAIWMLVELEGNISWQRLISTEKAPSSIVSNAESIWVSTWTEGLYKLREHNGKWKLIKQGGFDLGNISGLTLDHYSDLFVVSDNGIAIKPPALFQRPDEQENKYIQSIGNTDCHFFINDSRGIYHQLLPKGQTLVYQEEYDLILDAEYWKGHYLSAMQSGRLMVISPSGQVQKTWDLSSKVRSIISIAVQNEEVLFLGSGYDHIFLMDSMLHVTEVAIPDKAFIPKFLKTSGGKTYLGGEGSPICLFEFDPSAKQLSPVAITEEKTSLEDVLNLDETLYLGTDHGVLKHNRGQLERITVIPDVRIKALASDHDGQIWIGTGQGVYSYDGERTKAFQVVDGLPSSSVIERCMVNDCDGNIWVGTSSGICYSDLAYQEDKLHRPHLKSFYVNGQEAAVDEQAIQLIKGEYAVFKLSKPHLFDKSVKYRFLLDGALVSTSLSPEIKLDTRGLDLGKHTMAVTASSLKNHRASEPFEINITIRAAWFLRPWAWLLYLVGMTVIIYLSATVSSIRTRQSQKRLESIINERTASVNQQAKELREQRDFIQQQKEELEVQNGKMNQSIRSALDIQQGILPDHDKMSRLLGEHFLYYRPKDIVSGDFYWTGKVDGWVYLVVSDCTGHGVPGAFMSLLGVSLLNKIILQKDILELVPVLDRLHREFNDSLRSKTKDSDQFKVGRSMDVAITRFRPNGDGQTLLEFAGARMHLYYTDTDKGWGHIHGVRKGVGGKQNPKKQFQKEQLVLPKGSVIYIGSDGIADQNNPANKKYGTKKLVTFLQGIADKPIKVQGELLTKEIEGFKGTAFAFKSR
jgi:ligand-binding sensor domain-containing protein